MFCKCMSAITRFAKKKAPTVHVGFYLIQAATKTKRKIKGKKGFKTPRSMVHKYSRYLEATYRYLPVQDLGASWPAPLPMWTATLAPRGPNAVTGR